MKTLDRAWLAMIFPDPEELEEVIAEAIEDICQQLRELRSAVDEKNVQACREIAHRIKGVAANIGTSYIQANAVILEEAAAAGDTPLEPLFSRLSDSVDALCDA